VSKILGKCDKFFLEFSYLFWGSLFIRMQCTLCLLKVVVVLLPKLFLLLPIFSNFWLILHTVQKIYICSSPLNSSQHFDCAHCCAVFRIKSQLLVWQCLYQVSCRFHSFANNYFWQLLLTINPDACSRVGTILNVMMFWYKQCLMATWTWMVVSVMNTWWG